MDIKPSFDFPVDFNLPKFDANYSTKKNFVFIVEIIIIYLEIVL